MIRNIKFIIALFKIRMTHIMNFRLSFLGPFFIDTSYFLVQVFAFDAIYGHIDNIKGWGKGEILIYVGTFSLINGINMAIYFFGVTSIPDKIQTGELDLYLTKPMNPLLRITFEQINPGALPLILFSLCIINEGRKICGLSLDNSNIIGYVIVVLIMTILYYDLELIIRSFAFFTLSVESFVKVENTMIELCLKIPGIAFYGVNKVLFYYILPYGILATIPTQIITGAISLNGILNAGILVSIFTGIALSLWKYGLKNYESASS